MENKKVSIIIPIYNSEKYLKQCLDSIINQTYKNLEILCVNDGSTDDSEKIINNYQIVDDRIILLNKLNGGQSSARNYAYQYVTGDYVMFIDSDDWIDSDMIEEMLSEALAENADSVMCSYVREYEKKSLVTEVFDVDRFCLKDEEVISKFYRRLYGPIDEELKHPEKCDAPIAAWMQLFSRELALSSKFFDIKEIGTFEDGLYQISIYDKCKSFVYLNKPFYHYRKTNTDSSTSVYRADLFEKWNNLYDLLENLIKKNKLDEIYFEALRNRIALGVLQLCINETVSLKAFKEKKKKIKLILNDQRYSFSLNKLELTKMIFKWRVFFSFAKHKRINSLLLMSKLIVFLKGKVRN